MQLICSPPRSHPKPPLLLEQQLQFWECASKTSTPTSGCWILATAHERFSCGALILVTFLRIPMCNASTADSISRSPTSYTVTSLFPSLHSLCSIDSSQLKLAQRILSQSGNCGRQAPQKITLSDIIGATRASQL